MRAVCIALVTLLAGCSTPAGVHQSAPSPSPAPPVALATPTPPSMTPGPTANCAQPGPETHYVDALTGQPIDLHTERIISTRPSFASPEQAASWIVQRLVPPFDSRVVVPRVPAIVGAVVLGIHDEATVEILPSGKLADDYLRHIEYIASQAQLAVAAKAAGTNLPSPAPADVASEKAFNDTEATEIQALSLGSPPDDAVFQDDDGDPNAADPHRYVFACKFLESRPYTLILRTLIRKQEKNASYTAVVQRIDAEHGGDDAKGRTGYVPVEYVTLVARNVSPTLAPYVLLGNSKALLTNYPFSELARMKIDSAPPVSAPQK